MSESDPKNPESLQFETAEGGSATAGAITCAFCKKTIGDQYFEINGNIACGPCKEGAEAHRASGSKFKRFLKASLAGFVAALVGFGIYFAVLKLTGYEFGLIAIVVGLMVGGAVRWGCGARGGWAYQTLAIFLTYNAIVLTYVPLLYEQIKADKEAKSASTTPTGSPSTPATALSPVSTPSAVAPAVATPAVPNVTTSSAPTPPSPAVAAPAQPKQADAGKSAKKVTFLGFLVAVIVLFGVAYLLPFLAGFQNIIGWFILGIALYEAWKINKRPGWNVTGPYRVESSSSPETTPADKT